MPLTVKQINQPLVKTAKVLLLKGVVLAPGQVGRAGEIYELPKHMATQLVANRQAEYTDAGAPSEHDDAGAVAHKDGYDTVTVEAPTERDPKPKRKA